MHGYQFRKEIRMKMEEEEIERVSDIVCLGAKLSERGGTRKDIERRINKT